MHNLEGFGFHSDCFSLKDNLNYTSSAFQGPKPCFNHQICCHGPWLLCLPHRVTSSVRRGSWNPHFQGNGSKLQLQPPPPCKILTDFQPAAFEGWESCGLQTGKKDQHDLPSHSPLAMNNCFIFTAFVLLVCKNPNNYVVSDMKRHKSNGDHLQTVHKGSSVTRWSREILCWWVLLQVEGMKLGNTVISSLWHIMKSIQMSVFSGTRDLSEMWGPFKLKK